MILRKPGDNFYSNQPTCVQKFTTKVNNSIEHTIGLIHPQTYLHYWNLQIKTNQQPSASMIHVLVSSSIISYICQTNKSIKLVCNGSHLWWSILNRHLQEFSATTWHQNSFKLHHMRTECILITKQINRSKRNDMILSNGSLSSRDSSLTCIPRSSDLQFNNFEIFQHKLCIVQWEFNNPKFIKTIKLRDKKYKHEIFNVQLTCLNAVADTQ